MAGVGMTNMGWSRTSALTKVSCGLVLVSNLLYIVTFSSRGWATARYRQGDINVGLWKTCYSSDDVTETTSGVVCKSTVSFINSAWSEEWVPGTQTVFTMALVSSLLTSATTGAASLMPGTVNLIQNHPAPGFVAMCGSFTTAALGLVGIIVFGLRHGNESSLAGTNLDWCYGLTVACVFFYFIAAGMIFFQFHAINMQRVSVKKQRAEALERAREEHDRQEERRRAEAQRHQARVDRATSLMFQAQSPRQPQVLIPRHPLVAGGDSTISPRYGVRMYTGGHSGSSYTGTGYVHHQSTTGGAQSTRAHGIVHQPLSDWDRQEASMGHGQNATDKTHEDHANAGRKTPSAPLLEDAYKDSTVTRNEIGHPELFQSNRTMRAQNTSPDMSRRIGGAGTEHTDGGDCEIISTNDRTQLFQATSATKKPKKKRQPKPTTDVSIFQASAPVLKRMENKYEEVEMKETVSRGEVSGNADSNLYEEIRDDRDHYAELAIVPKNKKKRKKKQPNVEITGVSTPGTLPPLRGLSAPRSKGILPPISYDLSSSIEAEEKKDSATVMNNSANASNINGEFENKMSYATSSGDEVRLTSRRKRRVNLDEKLKQFED